MPTKNPLVGLFRSPEQGGWTNEDMMMIGDLIKSMMWKQAVEDPQEEWKKLTSMEYRKKRKEEETQRKKYKDQDLVLPGSRVPLEDAFAGMAPQQQPLSIESAMAAGGSPPPPMEIGPPTPSQDERVDYMWQQFQAMNPNLDYEAVARQSGGNIPGGSFSQMPESEAQKRQEQELYDFVNRQAPYDEAMRKLDPRSRGYDPKGAEVLLNMLESQRNAKIAEQEVAGRTQGTAADMIRARAAMMEAEAAKSLADRGLTSGGYPFGGGGGKNNELDQIADLADRVYSTNPKMTEDDMNAINAFILKGDRENAIRVLAKYVPQLGMNPDNAMPPAGAQAVARKEGRPAITPQGGEYVFTYGP